MQVRACARETRGIERGKRERDKENILVEHEEKCSLWGFQGSSSELKKPTDFLLTHTHFSKKTFKKRRKRFDLADPGEDFFLKLEVVFDSSQLSCLHEGKRFQ